MTTFNFIPVKTSIKCSILVCIFLLYVYQCFSYSRETWVVESVDKTSSFYHAYNLKADPLQSAYDSCEKAIERYCFLSNNSNSQSLKLFTLIQQSVAEIYNGQFVDYIGIYQDKKHVIECTVASGVTEAIIWTQTSCL
jgi:hypothetical protein